MRHIIISAVMVLSGCASAPVVRTGPDEVILPKTFELPGDTPGIRYEIGSYRYPRSIFAPAKKVIYRPTRGSADVGSPRIPSASGSVFPVSHDPLPANVVLAAELSKQRQITVEIAAIRDSLAGIERHAREQQQAFKTRADEIVKFREQLEGERSRLRERETVARGPVVEAAPAPAPSTTSAW